METVLQDVRYALRGLRKNPGFAAVAILTLALGIGANTAIFSVIDNVLIQPLPYPEPERLVRVMQQAPEGKFAVTQGAFSPQDFEDVKRESDVYEHLAAYYYIPSQSDMVLAGQGEPEELEAAFVSAEFFSALGMSAVLGRVMSAEENFPGADRVVVISSELWKSRFGSSPDAVGRTLQLEGEAFTVVGVMPPEFDYPSPTAQIWVPLSLIGEDDIPHQRGLRWLSVIGRLANGVTPDTAATATNAIAQQLERAFPDTNEGWGAADVVTLHESLVGDVKPALLMLMGAVGLVLLIACANLANILLARGNARSRELAVRAALGASRNRVLRQVLTESVVLAVIGGALGLVLASWGVDALVALSAGTIPRPDDVQLDWRVVGYTLFASLFTGVAFGLIPSLTASHVNVREALDEGGRGGTEGRKRQGVRAVLVVAQVALAVVLLTGAGLLVRSFWNLTHVDPGFAGENVLTLDVSTSSEVMDSERRDAYRKDIISRLENLPGVIAVGASKTAPLRDGGESYAFEVPGRSEPVTPESGVFPVTTDYFEALGIPLLRGRVFNTDDETASAQVLIVNRAFVERYLQNENAVGTSVGLLGADFRIVGVAGNVRNESIAQAPTPAVYIPGYIMPRSSMQVFVRTSSDPLRMINSIRQTIWDLNPDQPVTGIATMQQLVSETVARPRFFTLLLGGFSGIAMVLAAIGVYGVMAYTVSRRTHEMGIRMAIGARNRDVLRLIVGQGIVPALAGLFIGLVAAFALTRLLANLLYGVGAADPATFAGVAVLLLIVALLATYLPARRAARVEPIVALRAE